MIPYRRARSTWRSEMSRTSRMSMMAPITPALLVTAPRMSAVQAAPTVTPLITVRGSVGLGRRRHQVRGNLADRRGARGRARAIRDAARAGVRSGRCGVLAGFQQGGYRFTEISLSCSM